VFVAVRRFHAASRRRSRIVRLSGDFTGSVAGFIGRVQYAQQLAAYARFASVDEADVALRAGRRR